MNPKYQALIDHVRECSDCERVGEVLDTHTTDAELIHALQSLPLWHCEEVGEVIAQCFTLDFTPRMYSVIPMVRGNTPVCDAPEPGKIVELVTPTISWGSYRIVGIRFRMYRDRQAIQDHEALHLLGIDERLLVTDFRIGGSPNMFWHEDPADIQTYMDPEHFVRLRANPIVKAPNQALVTILRPPTDSPVPLQVSAEVIIEPVTDSGFSPTVQAYAGHDRVRELETAMASLLGGVQQALVELRGDDQGLIPGRSLHLDPRVQAGLALPRDFSEDCADIDAPRFENEDPSPEEPKDYRWTDSSMLLIVVLAGFGGLLIGILSAWGSAG